jgi:hypothetical protein
VVWFYSEFINHRDTEDTEVAQRRARSRLFVQSPLLTSSVGNVAAHTRLKPGMNLFSLRDDVEIGRRSASQVERQYQGDHRSPVKRNGTLAKCY